MSDTGAPAGFPSSDPAHGRESWRLLLVLLAVFALGAATFAAISYGFV